MADTALERGKVTTALAHAALAVRQSPMDAAAVDLLGEAQLAAGEQDAAFGTFAIGQQFGWRGAVGQAYQFEQAIAGGNARRAALHLDALLRLRAGDAALHSAIDRLLEQDGGHAALAERLSYRPRWRSAVLGGLDGLSQPALERRAMLVVEAIEAGAIRCTESRFFVTHAEARGLAIQRCDTPNR